MEYAAEPNLLLETLSYLGRKASGKTWTDTQNSIQRRKITVTEEFQCIFDKLTALTAQLDRKIILSEEKLTFFFANLEGMPHNTIGSGSIAFLLFYSVLSVLFLTSVLHCYIRKFLPIGMKFFKEMCLAQI